MEEKPLCVSVSSPLTNVTLKADWALKLVLFPAAFSGTVLCSFFKNCRHLGEQVLGSEQMFVPWSRWLWNMLTVALWTMMILRAPASTCAGRPFCLMIYC